MIFFIEVIHCINAACKSVEKVRLQPCGPYECPRLVLERLGRPWCRRGGMILRSACYRVRSGALRKSIEHRPGVGSQGSESTEEHD